MSKSNLIRGTAEGFDQSQLPNENQSKFFCLRKRFKMAFNFYSFLHNYGTRIAIFVIWLIVNSLVFYNTYQYYGKEPKFFYTRQMLQESLCISRACASVLNLNCALIILPMCQRLWSFIRARFSKFLKSSQRRLIDHNKGSHIYIAYAIFFFTALHTLGHLVNNYRFYQNFSMSHDALNLIPEKDELRYYTIFTTIPGITGSIMILVLVIMGITSLKFVRTKKYEVFWYGHKLYLVFFGALLCHGWGGVVKYQSNMDKHKPGCVYDERNASKRFKSDCSEEPRFLPVEPETWKWIIVPLFLFFIEKLHSLIVRNRHVDLNKVILHDGGVVELRMYQEGFQANPGQYIKIMCSNVSSLEWHSFTLAKCPSELNKEFWIQIKVVGKWTKFLSLLMPSLVIQNKYAKRLANTCTVSMEDLKEVISPESRIKISVEGPYGGPFQDVESFQSSLLICAGIGVTPFSAVLNSIRDKVIMGKSTGKLQRIYFIWICRNFEDFYWFLDTLYNIKISLNKEISQFLVCKLFVTRSAKINDEDTSLLSDSIAWMRTVVEYGRPSWRTVFTQVAEEHQSKRLGVFYCGPNSLSSELSKCSRNTNINQNSFIFHKESFG